MEKLMNKGLWLGVALLVVIGGIWGCNLFDRDKASPTGPIDAESLISGYVGGGSPGALYSAYVEVARFGVTLGTGCWRIEYYSKAKKGPFWGIAHIGSGLKLANVGMIRFHIGPADSAWVAKITGACPVDAGKVVLYGSGADVPSLREARQGEGVQVIANGKPTMGSAGAPGPGSPASAVQNFSPVRVAFLD
jgi:hypothetical protein